MTDRISGYVITLDKDMREDDAEAITNAIAYLRHVVSVQPVVADVGIMIAESRAKNELRMKLFEALK